MKKIIPTLLVILAVFLNVGMAQAESVKYKLTMSINSTTIETRTKITISGKITPTKETRVWMEYNGELCGR